MDTYEIDATVLDNYKNDKLSDERINALIKQANEQLDEISKNKEIYDSFKSQVNAPENIDNIILWILLMSDEDICCEFISKFDKDFTDMIPVGDLADLLLYISHLNKVKNIELEGLEYLLKYESEGIHEMDQYCFTNVFLYIQKSKQVEMSF